MSKTKIEQKAITKIRDVIDNIELFTYKFSEMDKDISWDGFINMYHGDVDKKDNFDATIDVQIKGRTTPNKRLRNKHRFSLDRADLNNYLKKDGTILLLCLFKSDDSDYKIYYANLLPYNIRKMLEQYSSSTVKIDMKEIESSSHLENICRNFKIDRDMQKGISENVYNESNLTSQKGKIAKFYIWDKDISNFDPQSLVGSWQYIYTLDENGYTINISYGELTNLIEKLNAKIYDKDKKIIYDDIELETKIDTQRLLFGKAFSLDLQTKLFNINICGSLFERIKQLRFISKMFKNQLFLINDAEFNIKTNKKEEKRFNELLDKYIDLEKFLKNHNISKDINLDDWDEKDFYRLSLWMTAIEEKKELKLNSNISLVGSINIKDLRLSVFAEINENKNFTVQSLWNNDIAFKYYFKYTSSEGEISTNNFYLVLNSEAYQSDDINILEMKNAFEKNKVTNNECILMNLQVLEVLKAYDITKNKDLLEYAGFLSKLLLDNDKNNPVYYINYSQVLRRLNQLDEKNIEKLIEIRDNTSDTEIKLGCNLLLDNKNEVNYIIKKMDSQTLIAFKNFPISIYMN